MKTISVLIPVYNEARTIKPLVQKIKGFGFDAVVVDDGSTDHTSRLAEDAGAFIIRHDINKGKGASIRAGIKYILSKPYSAAIIMDGDGQHDPAEIYKFLQHAEKTNSLIISGNRMSETASMPLIRLLTNIVMSRIISFLCKQCIPDTQCGYRYIKKEALEKLDLSSSKFDIESEVLIEASRLGIKIESIPIKTIYQKEESKIQPFIDTLRFIRLLIIKIFTRKRR